MSDQGGFREDASAFRPWWAAPMNSQPARTELARRIIGRCAIERFIETGTFAGSTTEFFARFKKPVISAELNPEFAVAAREYLQKWTNVDVRLGDSVAVLQQVIAETADRSRPTFFYLDAHWENHLPLREEVELALNNFRHAVLMIDDFAVPGDPGYTFDDYGPGKRLDLSYLLTAQVPPMSIYFPSTPSHTEGGSRRGCVVVTASPKMTGILDKIGLLRRWKPSGAAQ